MKVTDFWSFRSATDLNEHIELLWHRYRKEEHAGKSIETFFRIGRAALRSPYDNPLSNARAKCVEKAWVQPDDTVQGRRTGVRKVETKKSRNRTSKGCTKRLRSNRTTSDFLNFSADLNDDRASPPSIENPPTVCHVTIKISGPC